MRVHAEEAHHQRNARYRFRLRLSHKSAAAAGGTFRGSNFVAVGLQKPSDRLRAMGTSSRGSARDLCDSLA